MTLQMLEIFKLGRAEKNNWGQVENAGNAKKPDSNKDNKQKK